MQAFEYLQTTELFKENNITLSEDWKNIDQDSDLILFELHDKLDENDSDSSDTELIKEEVSNTIRMLRIFKSRKKFSSLLGWSKKKLACDRQTDMIIVIYDIGYVWQMDRHEFKQNKLS